MNRHATFCCALVIALLASGPALRAAPISITAGTYSQNFDTLANSGTSSTLPDGWAISETGTNANTTYTAGTGSSNTGDTYSFGASGSNERALGGLLSGSLVPTFGAEFKNDGTSAINALAIAYTGEQWRLGATGRADRLDFQYSLNATSLTTGTWVDVNALDFSSPVTTGTVGALDGNSAANRTAISSTNTGINIPQGGTFWIRFNDLDVTGSDDGLAVDNFSVTPTFAAPAAAPVPLPGSALIWLIGVGCAGGFGLRRRLWAASR